MVRYENKKGINYQEAVWTYYLYNAYLAYFIYKHNDTFHYWVRCFFERAGNEKII